MADNLVLGLGAGSGDGEWTGDFVLTDTDSSTALFKVAQSTGLISGKSGNMQQTLYRGITPFSTAVGTGAQVAQTYALPAAILAANGQAIRVTAWGTYAANADVKTAALIFGATTVATTGAVASNGTTWYLQADVFRLSATTQTSIGAAVSGTTVHANLAAAPGETLSGAITITCTLTDGTSAAADIVCSGMIVEFLP